jgi:hypothetical protein
MTTRRMRSRLAAKRSAVKRRNVRFAPQIGIGGASRLRPPGRRRRSPAPTERGVRISRTTLFGSWFTAFTAICSSFVSMVSRGSDHCPRLRSGSGALAASVSSMRRFSRWGRAFSFAQLHLDGQQLDSHPFLDRLAPNDEALQFTSCFHWIEPMACGFGPPELLEYIPRRPANRAPTRAAIRVHSRPALAQCARSRAL